MDCDSFTYRYHISSPNNYFCCPFLSSELSATCIGILLARRSVYCGSQLFKCRVHHLSTWLSSLSLLSSSSVEWSDTAQLHGSCRQSLSSYSLLEAGTACLHALVVNFVLVLLCLQFVGSSTFSLAICTSSALLLCGSICAGVLLLYMAVVVGGIWIAGSPVQLLIWPWSSFADDNEIVHVSTV